MLSTSSLLASRVQVCQMLRGSLGCAWRAGAHPWKAGGHMAGQLPHPMPTGLSRGLRGGQPLSVASRAQAENISSASEPPAPAFVQMSQYCRQCGGPMNMFEESKDTWRHICGDCEYIDYFNPKMVVGCVVEHQGKILLCKRGIEPCKGKWTIPAGFMELKESTTEGAKRETYEEATAEVDIIAPYFHMDVPVIGQSYVLFRSSLAAPYTFAPGPESLDVQMFAPDEIPFDELAFSTVSITLKHYLEEREAGRFRIHHATIQKVPGSAPNDAMSFKLVDHMAFHTDDRPADSP